MRGALKGRSFAELGDRAVQAGHAAMERMGLSSDTAVPTATDWHAELREGSGQPFKDAAAALSEFRAKAPTRFLAGTSDIAATVAAIRMVDPSAESRTIEIADAAAAGQHWLLGYDALDYGTPPDWHLDPVHDRRAPLAHWSAVPYLDERVVGDHKVTWELNRHQWLVLIAKAYHFTGDEQWAERALAHIDAWIEANPRKQGINWASSLEIAFRGISWLWVLYLLRDAEALTAERFARMVRVLAVGGRHVERHLSTWFSPNTHLTGEALGLLYLGCAIPEMNAAARWRRLGMAILAERMPEHLRADGTYIEQSTHYARYTVDFLIHAIALARRSGEEVPQALTDALRRGAEFLRNVARPDGTIPLIGDDDGGRLLFLDPVPANDVRPTLAVACAITGDTTLVCSAGEPSEEVAWLLGPAALRVVVSVAQPVTRSRFFPDGGIATLRDGWGHDASVAVFDCGPHGMGNGGHAHADLGSIDLTLRGRPVVVDPGTFSYLTGEGARDGFRGAAAHAVPMVDGHGSAEPGGAFSWSRAPRVMACSAHLSPECDIVAFSHDGFLHLEDPVSHRRSLVRVRRDYWLVIDNFRSVHPHDVSISFPLAAQLRVAVDGLRAVIGDARGEVARFVTSVRKSEWEVADMWTSTAYGRREPAVRLVQRASFTGNLVAATLVQPADDVPLISLGVNVDGDSTILSIERGGRGCDVFRLRENSGSFDGSAGEREEWHWPAQAAVVPKKDCS